jgi:TolB-like protein/Flp pilus assembly protein TadD
MPAEQDLDKHALPTRNGEAAAQSTSHVPKEAVLAALEKVVASPAFAKAERPSRFLRHLVETALRGEGHLLKETVLGMDVFDRPSSWDPRLDPVVRQEASRLRKRLAKYYETGEPESTVRIELPIGSYVPLFREKSPEIETARAGNAAPDQVTVRKSRTWWYSAGGLCVICIGALIAWRAVPRHESTTSIAVLPFANLSADPANQYFADGLTDEITDSLARLKTVRVIARSSAFQFKGKTPDIREVGRSLNVTNVLEGSVERSGDRVKIIAHLERVSDGSLLWSNTYERKASDLFAVQAELAAGIASSLKVASGAPGAKHVPNGEAHDLVIKARYEMQQMTTESVTRAETEYQRAIDLDPEYAAAYLGLANTKYDQFVARGSAFQTEAERGSAEQLLHKALELDPDLPTAHAMLATFAMQYDWDWDRAEREFRLAVSGPSSATAESFYAFLLVFRGRFAEADRHVQRMVDLDPFSTATMNNLGVIRNLEGRFAEAREIAQKMAAQSPAMIAPQQMIGGTYIEEGHPELAFPIFRQLKQRYPQAQLFEAMAYAATGQREEALRLIRPYEEKYPNAGVSMGWFAFVYALLDDEPDTVKWVQRSVDMHEWQALSLAVNPVYARMQNSPGFQALKKRMGLDQ